MIDKILLEKPCLLSERGFAFLAISLTLFLTLSCAGNFSDPQKIVDETILVYGGEKYQHSTIEFDFRKRHYIAWRDGGKFSFERIFKDSTSTVHDFLTNAGFLREKDSHPRVVADSMAKKYTASVNSVIYFALLPYPLNDPSVNKKLMGTTTLDGESYYKIEITFGKEAGGDYRDTFYYWIHQKNFTMDYFAYFYEEDKVWEMRFRKAMNRRTVNGIVFQDYINYKPKTPAAKFEEIEQLFKSNQLEELSRIDLENISVK